MGLFGRWGSLVYCCSFVHGSSIHRSTFRCELCKCKFSPLLFVCARLIIPPEYVSMRGELCKCQLDQECIYALTLTRVVQINHPTLYHIRPTKQKSCWPSDLVVFTPTRNNWSRQNASQANWRMVIASTRITYTR